MVTLLEAILTLSIITILLSSSSLLLQQLPKRVHQKMTTQHLYQTISQSRLTATYTDRDVTITPQTLPASFFITGKSQKIGLKPYFKTKFANTIANHHSPFKVSLSVGLSTLNLKE